MKATWYERKTCRLCDAPVALALALKPSPLANRYTSEPETQERYPLDLMQCTGCGHAQLGAVVSPAVLYADYRYRSGTSEAFRAHLEALARELSAVRSGFVVEIGSNDGTLLKAFEALGHPTLGVDPAGTYNCLPECFSAAMVPEIIDAFGQPEIIVANNVLAHIDDLRGTLKAIKALLSPTGIFVFEVQYLPDLISGQRFDLIYHEHLDYHHFYPLRLFLERALDLSHIGRLMRELELLLAIQLVLITPLLKDL